MLNILFVRNWTVYCKKHNSRITECHTSHTYTQTPDINISINVLVYLFLHCFLGKPLHTLVCLHSLQGKEIIVLQIQNMKSSFLVTSFKSWSAFGSILDSCLKASSPTKQISWPSCTHDRAMVSIEVSSLGMLTMWAYWACSQSHSLTGSASMTTRTVAFPGVSKLTKGVRILKPPSLLLCS